MIPKDTIGNFLLPELPYTDDYLEPYIGERTVRYHYWKHTKAYLDKVNTLNGHKERTLEQVVLCSELDGDSFKNASQALNHFLYFEQLNPDGAKTPLVHTEELIKKSFGSLENLKDFLVLEGMNVFGSGWVFLTKNYFTGSLSILSFTGTGTPLKNNTILIALDVWEHAYYLDYQNNRRLYIENFFKALDWRIIEKRLESSIY